MSDEFYDDEALLLEKENQILKSRLKLIRKEVQKLEEQTIKHEKELNNLLNEKKMLEETNEILKEQRKVEFENDEENEDIIHIPKNTTKNTTQEIQSVNDDSNYYIKSDSEEELTPDKKKRF